MHARLAPARHRFAYRIFLFGLDLDELDQLPRVLRWFSLGRRNAYSFRDADYLPTHEPVFNGSSGSQPHVVAAGSTLKSRVVALLAARGIDLTGGRVVLLTLPRVFGYLFNPVSFYFCFDRHGAPVASIAEVTNTFREMKPFVLGPETRLSPGPALPAARTDSETPALAPEPGAVFRLRAPKHFYVSPFSDVDVAFDFRLRVPADRLAVQIDDYTGAQRTLTSTLTGRRRPLTDANLAWFTLKYPLITVRVITLIHWHAARLWLKRVPWFAKAARPSDQRDLYRPHPGTVRSSEA